MFKDITKGADLTHPKASVGWLVNGVVAVVVLLVVIASGMWIYGKAIGTGAGAVKSSVASLAAGTFGDGS